MAPVGPTTPGVDDRGNRIDTTKSLNRMPGIRAAMSCSADITVLVRVLAAKPSDECLAAGVLNVGRYTCAPSATKRRAIASPMPLAAPVTMATFPCSRCAMELASLLSRDSLAQTWASRDPNAGDAEVAR